MTDTSVEAMVERLRKLVETAKVRQRRRSEEVANAMDEAADLLASQAQQIAALRSAATSALAVIDTDEYPRIVKSLISALSQQEKG